MKGDCREWQSPIVVRVDRRGSNLPPALTYNARSIIAPGKQIRL